MGNQLAVYLFVYNTEKILYPWRESIRSALALTEGRGAVFVCHCAPVHGIDEDDTYAALVDEFAVEITDGRLKLSEAVWGSSHEVQVGLGNFLLDQIGRDYQYALKLDADEVLHEASFEVFWRDLHLMTATYKILGKPHYTHFCSDPFTTFPFIYDSKAVLSATRSGQRFHDNDACALGGGGIPEYQTRLEIYHYGKMGYGREREALTKEVEFTKLYYDLGFPDQKVEAQRPAGWLDYYKVFDVAMKAGDFKRFNGVHPKFMDAYLEAAAFREEKFRAELALHEFANRD